MTHKLPPNLLALFAPRPALRYLPPSDHAPEERKTNNIGGMAQYLDAMKEYEDILYEPTESWLQKKDRKRLEKKEKQERLLTEGFSECMRSRPLSCCCNLIGVHVADNREQTSRRRILKSEATHSRRSLWLG